MRKSNRCLIQDFIKESTLSPALAHVQWVVWIIRLKEAKVTTLRLMALVLGVDTIRIELIVRTDEIDSMSILMYVQH